MLIVSRQPTRTVLVFGDADDWRIRQFPSAAGYPTFKPGSQPTELVDRCANQVPVDRTVVPAGRESVSLAQSDLDVVGTRAPVDTGLLTLLCCSSHSALPSIWLTALANCAVTDW